MSAYNYIVSSDINATVASDFELSGYLERANNHIDTLAYSVGVPYSGIAYPVDFLLKEYGVAWFYRAIYQDKIGANNNSVGEGDKYLLLYNIQNDEVERLRKYMTYDVLVGEATTPNSTASSVTLFRG